MQPNPKWEEALQNLVREYGHLPPQAFARLREDVRLQFEYPDQYVAYIDSWQRTGSGRQLVRKVIAHSACYADVYEQFVRLPADIRAKVELHYMIDPEGPLEYPRCEIVDPDGEQV